MKLRFSFVVVTALVSTHAYAGVDSTFNDEHTYETGGLFNAQTTGLDHEGSSVFVEFADGSTEVAVWPAASTVAGTDWSLTAEGDTFAAEWEFTNTSAHAVERIRIDFGPSGIAIDTANGGTPGSGSNGKAFQLLSPAAREISGEARHAGQIALTDSDPVGDLYRVLDIAFVPGDALAPGETLVFELDTDSAQPYVCASDITCDGSVSVEDLLAMLKQWGPCLSCPADIDHDGIVDVIDLLTLLADWG